MSVQPRVVPEGTTPDHGVNVIGVAASILAMFFRANVVVPSLLASLAVALAFSGSLTGAVIFRSSPHWSRRSSGSASSSSSR